MADDVRAPDHQLYLFTGQIHFQRERAREASGVALHDSAPCARLISHLTQLAVNISDRGRLTRLHFKMPFPRPLLRFVLMNLGSGIAPRLQVQTTFAAIFIVAAKFLLFAFATIEISLVRDCSGKAGLLNFVTL